MSDNYRRSLCQVLLDYFGPEPALLTSKRRYGYLMKHDFLVSQHPDNRNTKFTDRTLLCSSFKNGEFTIKTTLPETPLIKINLQKVVKAKQDWESFRTKSALTLCVSVLTFVGMHAGRVWSQPLRATSNYLVITASIIPLAIAILACKRLTEVNQQKNLFPDNFYNFCMEITHFRTALLYDGLERLSQVKSRLPKELQDKACIFLTDTEKQFLVDRVFQLASQKIYDINPLVKHYDSWFKENIHPILVRLGNSKSFQDENDKKLSQLFHNFYDLYFLFKDGTSNFKTDFDSGKLAVLVKGKKAMDEDPQAAKTFLEQAAEDYLIYCYTPYFNQEMRRILNDQWTAWLKKQFEQLKDGMCKKMLLASIAANIAVE